MTGIEPTNTEQDNPLLNDFDSTAKDLNPVCGVISQTMDEFNEHITDAVKHREQIQDPIIKGFSRDFQNTLKDQAENLGEPLAEESPFIKFYILLRSHIVEKNNISTGSLMKILNGFGEDTLGSASSLIASYGKYLGNDNLEELNSSRASTMNEIKDPEKKNILYLTNVIIPYLIT